ncbi:MAG TPA: hypothetical protein VKA09_03380 [Nitrososphaeraceae archaeon]|nr:hypothetical protein [Nitrososphaeraceae archaeon]
MLGKTSVSMMVLLVAASLIGISSVHQYLEAQTPTPTPTQREVQLKGRVVAATISASKTCTAFVALPEGDSNLLRLPPGTRIFLSAPNSEGFCILFGLSKIGNTQIQFVTQPATSSDQRRFTVTQVSLQ